MRKLIGVALLLIVGIAAKAQIPCLTGTVATGVLAFYPYTATSTNDESGWGHHLVDSGAVPMPDRYGNTDCAYYFEKDLTCAASDYMITSPAFLDNLFTLLLPTFSVSLWYKPVTPVVPYSMGNYELLLGRGNPGICAPIHCPDTWQEWSLGLYDCRQAVAGVNQYNTWENAAGTLGCTAFYA